MGCGGNGRGRNARRCVDKIALIFIFLALATLAACGGGNSQGLPDNQSLAPVAPDSGFSLPAPSVLRSASYEPADLVCCGAEYVLTPGFPVQNTSIDGECCTFSPSWTPEIHPPEGLAYACYAFGLEDYDRPHTVTFTWDAAGAADDLWIGFADFNRDCWSWHQPPDGCLLTTDLSAYIDAETHDILAVVLFTGTSPWQLSRIKIGDLAALSGQVFQNDGETPLFDAEVTAIGAGTYSARVDYEGNWFMPGVPPDGYSVSAHLIGWHIAPAERSINVDRVDVIVDQFIGTPLPTHTVSGRVLESPGLDGLRGVQVEISPQDGTGGSVSTWTEFGGEWYIDIPNGDYVATPSMAGWSFTPGNRLFSVNNSDTMVQDFHGEKLPSYSIDGYVYESDGTTPVEDVQINLVHHELEIYLYASTDSFGYWYVEDAIDGDYTVSPLMPGWIFEPASREITVSGTSLTVDPFLGTELGQFTVDGYIYLQDGVTPVPDVEVQLTGDGWFWASTDKSGHYIFDGVFAGSDYSVTPMVGRYEFTPPDRTINVTGDITVDPFLATKLPAYTVDGYIFKADGTTPVVGVYVDIYSYMGGVSFELYTDVNGHYVAAEVPVGFYAVWPSKQGYTFVPEDQAIQVIDQDLTVDDFTGTSLPAYAMDGYVYELDGTTPVPGVKIAAYGWMYWFETETDALGHWVITEAFEDTYEVTPSLAPWEFTPPSRSVEISGGDETVPAFLGEELEAYTVDGYIFELDTTIPVPDVELQCFNGATTYYCTTDSAGHYEIPLPNGDWTVYPEPDCWSFMPEYQDITVDGAPLTLDEFFAIPGG